jgi:hypothetical protein
VYGHHQLLGRRPGGRPFQPGAALGRGHVVRRVTTTGTAWPAEGQHGQRRRFGPAAGGRPTAVGAGSPPDGERHRGLMTQGTADHLTLLGYATQDLAEFRVLYQPGSGPSTVVANPVRCARSPITPRRQRPMSDAQLGQRRGHHRQHRI